MSRAPSDATNRVVDQIRAARESKSTLRIQGAGTWLDAGRPVRAERTLSLADDRGIVEYVPGDLTLTARAGTRLSEIVTATRNAGQWLPLDPWGDDDGTLGATMATASAGPHASTLGLPRDVALGLEFVTGNGDVVVSGGRVVKNVAGFDLTRLLVGSWGTIGVITEVTVRLRALPEHSRSIVIGVAGDASALNDLAVRLRALPFAPVACELVCDALAGTLGLPRKQQLLVRIGGNRRSVDSQLDLLRHIGSVTDADEALWPRLRSAPKGAASWRWSQLPSAFGDTWSAAERAANRFDGAFVHGQPLRGVARVVVPDASRADATSLAKTSHVFEGTITIEALPAVAWPVSAANDRLSRGVRDQFDPARILNTGIMGIDS